MSIVVKITFIYSFCGVVVAHHMENCIYYCMMY